jgi:hypothetical protein
MRTPIQVALCLAAILACCHASTAQRRRAGVARPAAPAPSRATPAPRWTILSQTDFETHAGYDHPNETVPPTTLVILQPMPVAPPAGAKYSMAFGLNYAYQGGDPARVKNISLNLFSRSPACSLPEKPSLALSLDGRTLPLPYQPDAKGAEGVFWATSESEGATCNESVGVFVSPATLARLAAARAVSGKIGSNEFQLTPDNLAALRELVSRVMPTRAPRGARR